MANIQVRVDEDLKKQAQEVAAALGMEVATTIRIFLRQMVRDRALPFTPSLSLEAGVEDKSKKIDVDNEGTNRHAWLRNAVNIGLEALENNDYATAEEVAGTFKKAGVNVD